MSLLELPRGFRYTVDPDLGCWLWDGYCAKNGYARIYNPGKKQIEWAHRFSYEAHKGELIDGLEVDHLCQRTACVNPDHLDAVTRAEHTRRTYERLGKNDKHLAAAQLRRMGRTYTEIADILGYATRTAAKDAVRAAVTKGLIAADQIPAVSRLTDAEYQEIREMYSHGVSQVAIGSLFGVHPSQVSRICSGKRPRGKKRDAA